MKNVSEKGCRENKNTFSMFNHPPLPPENLAIYEIRWKNTYSQTGHR
jgi:hypothetical protein